MGYLSANFQTNAAMASPTVNASAPLQAIIIARMRFRLNYRQSSMYLLYNARKRKSNPASLISAPINARKNGNKRPMLPSTVNPPAGTVSAQIACAVFLKYSASSFVSSDMPSSLMMLKSFFFSSASCQRAEVSCARVFRFALSGVEGTFPLRKIHCPRNLGSSNAAVPSTFISSSNSASEEAKVQSTLKICQFLLQYSAPCVVSTISPCIFSLAAWATSSAERRSLLSLRINLTAVSTRCLVSNSMSVCSRAQCSWPMRESVACDLTMWSIKLGFVNNVIQQGHTQITHHLINTHRFKNIPYILTPTKKLQLEPIQGKHQAFAATDK